LIAAAVAVQHMPGDTSGVALAAASPWQAATGFRLNSPATIRAALRLGEHAHWLGLERADKGEVVVTLGGKHHRVDLRMTGSGEVSGTIDGRPVSASCEVDHDRVVLRRQCLRFEFHDDTGAEHRASAEHEGHFRAPMPGHVLDVRVAEGQSVRAGAVLVVLEAMKMEHSLTAPWDGRVHAVHVRAGDRVEEGADIVLLQPATES
jgi:acetyl/propionyl-CoA carboxylase alpha subunit